MSIPEAFLLLTIPNATVSVPGTSQSGTLGLECVTIQVPNASTKTDRDVYLVLHLDEIECPIDPTWVIQRTDHHGHRTYFFHPTDSDRNELVVLVALPTNANPNFFEDLGTLDTILAQYSSDFRAPLDATGDKTANAPCPNEVIGADFPGVYGDLKGHLVVVDQDSGDVVGQFDNSIFKVQEDPRLHEYGHENDAVIIEVPDNRPGDEQDATALQMFVRAVPSDQQDWITKSATIVSHAISTTTNLLLTTITTASNYYISHSKPSPHHSESTSVAPTPPPRALIFLTSERTRKGLAGVHAVSGHAVTVSSKTVSTIDGMIRHAMGSKPKRERYFATPTALKTPNSNAKLSPAPSRNGGMPPQLPPRTPSPLYAHLSPAYSGQPSPPDDKKPPLPSRRSPSPVPPLPPRTHSGIPNGAMPSMVSPQPRGPLSKKERVLLSADLIFSTLDHDTRRLLDMGSTAIGSIVGHKYGPEAAETSLLVTGTTRNVGLVYVDMRGIGRRALLRSAGKQFIRGRLSSHRGQEPQ